MCWGEVCYFRENPPSQDGLIKCDRGRRARKGHWHVRGSVCGQADGSLELTQGRETRLKSLMRGVQEVLAGWLEKREVMMWVSALRPRS